MIFVDISRDGGLCCFISIFFYFLAVNLFLFYFPLVILVRVKKSI